MTLYTEIGTPVTRAMWNVPSDFDFFLRLFVLELGARKRQAGRRTDGRRDKTRIAALCSFTVCFYSAVHLKTRNLYLSACVLLFSIRFAAADGRNKS